MGITDYSLDSIISLKRFDDRITTLLKSLQKDYVKENRNVRASIFTDENYSNTEFENRLIEARTSSRTLEIIEILSASRRISARDSFRSTPDYRAKTCLVLYEV